MISKLKKLPVVARERVRDRLSGQTPVANSQKQTGDTQFTLESYLSQIPIDPLLHQLSYRTRPQDVLIPGEQPQLKTEFDYDARLCSNARVLSDGLTHMSVFDAQNRFLSDYSSHTLVKPAHQLRRKISRSIQGLTINLCAPLASIEGNYGHWLLDSLARWILFEDRSTTPVTINNFLIPARRPAFLDSLQALGVAEARIVELQPHEVYEFEQLLCVARPRGYSSHITPGWLIQGYRQRLLPRLEHADAPGHRKIYINRLDAKSRKLRQEFELIEQLQQRGYESVTLSGLGLMEKVELFSQASEVIGLSGAGMMSVMFCPPSARVVELFPHGMVNYQFASICSALGQEHIAYMLPKTLGKSVFSPNSGQLNIDLQDFMAVVDRHSQS